MAHRPLGLPPLPPALAAFGAWFGTRAEPQPGFWAWLTRQLLEERERWILWLPVGLGVGVVCYFVLPVEPPRPEDPIARAFAAARGDPALDGRLLLTPHAACPSSRCVHLWPIPS